MLSELESSKKVVGTKQAKKALIKDEVDLLYIADNADKIITDELVQIAEEKSVRVIKIKSMEELGKACGIDVSAASVARLK